MIVAASHAAPAPTVRVEVTRTNQTDIGLTFALDMAPEGEMTRVTLSIPASQDKLRGLWRAEIGVSTDGRQLLDVPLELEVAAGGARKACLRVDTQLVQGAVVRLRCRAESTDTTDETVYAIHLHTYASKTSSKRVRKSPSPSSMTLLSY
jgi:hypothetical protein